MTNLLGEGVTHEIEIAQTVCNIVLYLVLVSHLLLCFYFRQFSPCTVFVLLQEAYVLCPHLFGILDKLTPLLRSVCQGIGFCMLANKVPEITVSWVHMDFKGSTYCGLEVSTKRRVSSRSWSTTSQYVVAGVRTSARKHIVVCERWHF